MKRHSTFKLVLIVGVILACIYGIIGIPTSKQQLVDNFHSRIHLGLDLTGGTYLVIQVNQWDAFNTDASQEADRLKEQFRKSNIPYGDIDIAESHTLADAKNVAILVKGVPPANGGDARRVVSETLPEWKIDSSGANEFRLTMLPTPAQTLWKSVLAQAKTTIDNKVNALGLTEASVQQRREDADSQLMIEMPNVGDPEHVKQILQTAAKLELYDVRGGPFNSREEALASVNGILPVGTKIIGSPMQQGGSVEGGYYIVARSPEVRGQDIADAKASQNPQNGTWETEFHLKQSVADRFGEYTGSHIGQRLAIVLDDKVLEAPNIKGQIRDNGQIEGARDQQAAADLALNLKAGSLPATVTFLQEETVGPSLGADSIRDGFAAGIAGVIAVVIAMLIYYKRSGINATLALILNAIILVACLSYFDAVLTLPGIAGIILTIGMAVDSNVLIFERIREELRAGKAVPAAVSAGFDKALLTIIDTHVTTVVSCAILFFFGPGPVKGFAVTLVIGLIANVFTAVFVSRYIFDWELSSPKPVEALSI